MTRIGQTLTHNDLDAMEESILTLQEVTSIIALIAGGIVYRAYRDRIDPVLQAEAEKKAAKKAAREARVFAREEARHAKEQATKNDPLRRNTPKGGGKK